MIEIDWHLLSRAKDYYSGLGYNYVETPWIADIEAVAATYHSPRFDVDGGCLVGSGEQGLLQLAHQGKITPGKWMTISPCFRDEPVYDNLHQKQFIKLELMRLGDYTDSSFEMVAEAADLFRMLRPNCLFHMVSTSEGVDLEHRGVEVGSYGWRGAVIYGRRYCWTYGTGLALPRFSLS